MTPLEVRARIESLLRSSPSPEAAALLSRMPRPLCGTPGCAGKLSRNTGKCGKCGAAKTRTVDRYTRGDGTHFDRERGDRRSIPQTIQPGTAVVAEQSLVVDVEKLPTRHRGNVALSRFSRLADERRGAAQDEGGTIHSQGHAAAEDEGAPDAEAPAANP